MHYSRRCILFVRILGVIKELAYTAAAAALLVGLYSAWRVRSFGDSKAQELADMRRDIAARPPMVPGKTVGIAGVDLAASPYSILIVTSPSCTFCVSSRQFHRAVAIAARKQNIPVVVAVPLPDSDIGFLKAFGLDAEIVKGWKDVTRRPQGTPSVALIDRFGIIRRMWLGELTSVGQTELLTAIRDPANVTPLKRRLLGGDVVLGAKGAMALVADGALTIISVEERPSYKQEHPPFSINIPLAELSVRARSELHLDKAYAIDCTALEDVACSVAVDRIRKTGIKCSAVDYGIDC